MLYRPWLVYVVDLIALDHLQPLWLLRRSPARAGRAAVATFEMLVPRERLCLHD